MPFYALEMNEDLHKIVSMHPCSILTTSVVGFGELKDALYTELANFEKFKGVQVNMLNFA